MKCALAVILALCLLAPAFGARDVGGSRQLTGLNKRAVCTAKSSLKLRVFEEGKCVGLAKANCDVFVSVYDQIRKASAKWEADGICQQNSVLAAARAFARAYVKVFVSAVAKVTCKSHNKKAYAWGCGWAIAKGSGTGQGLAKATAQAWADADPNKESFDAFCDADVEALGTVLVEIAQKAQADICTNSYIGTPQVDFEVFFVEKAQCAIADVLARASAGFCERKGKAYGGKFSNAKAFSRCNGSAEVIKFECNYY